MRNELGRSSPKLLWFLLLGAAVIGVGIARTAPLGSDEVLGFDMWCLEMALYPAAQCDARRPDDLKEYQQYRRSLEQYRQQQAAREKREQDLKDKLNRDPIDTKRPSPGGPSR